jgi:hypothetical protein
MPSSLRASATAALVLLVVGRGAAEPVPLPPFDAATDRVVARTVVPDDIRRQGEVRLVTRGDATVVQTLLATTVLRRVVAEIRKKEERNWPADAACHADMLRYVDAVAAAARELEEAAGDEGARRRLVIEFVAAADRGGILIGEFQGDRVDGALRPTSVRVMATPAVGRDYLLRNMRLILADAFDLEDDEVDRLGPLGPAAR